MNKNWSISPWFFVPQVLLLCFLLVAGLHLWFLDKTYPGIKVANIEVGNAKKDSLYKKISAINKPESLTLKHQNSSYNLNTTDFLLEYDIEATTENALAFGRNKSLFLSYKHKLASIMGDINLPLVYTLEEDKLNELISLISSQVSKPPIEPEVSLKEGVVSVYPGKKGFLVDENDLKNKIVFALANASISNIQIPITNINPELTEQQVLNLHYKAKNLLNKQLQLTFENQTFTYNDTVLFALLTPSSLKENKLNELIAEVSAAIERPSQNARFTFDGNRVKEFIPALNEIRVEREKLKQALISNIEILSSTTEKHISFKIATLSFAPEINNSQVNSLGIKELIGRGTSNFKGSIPGRIHNLSLAASRINGILIKPNDIFSFNETVKEISASTGYQPAYIISDGRTILGDGGGVCQTSTTLFRAVLNTGLPVLERHDHAYRVSYYEQDSKPGFDATVYVPSVDFKFKNNTSSHILVQSKIDKTKSLLTVELYGTADGRIAEISNIRLWDVHPAPAPLYQDDPSLPIGKTKQVDYATPGGKAAFDYKVIRKNIVLENKTFYSSYKAWQAVYLRGTAPGQ